MTNIYKGPTDARQSESYYQGQQIPPAISCADHWFAAGDRDALNEHLKPLKSRGVAIAF